MKIETIFICAFAKLQKATFSFVMSVRLFGWDNFPLSGQIYLSFMLQGPRILELNCIMTNVMHKFLIYLSI
jgi:hypothetical protein